MLDGPIVLLLVFGIDVSPVAPLMAVESRKNVATAYFGKKGWRGQHLAEGEWLI